MSTELQYTPPSEVKSIYERLTATFKAGVTRPLAYRRKQLLQLGRMLQENHAAFEDAFYADYNKPRLEITAEDLAPPIPSIIRALEKLEEWARPEKPTVEAWRSTWDTTLHKVPKGVALIISPFNYPYILSFNPMVGAIAAGCPVVLKPSEANPNASALMTKLVPKYLDPNAYAVVNGGPEETTALLEFRWDHIFFTGGTRVGQIVASAAAKHITPVTLELGGKSPVIIDPDCDIDLAAKRVLYGKLQNMGQLCASPDYVLLPRSVAPAFRESLAKWYKSFWPNGPLHETSQWGKIVNTAHHQRLKRLIEQSKGTIILGGEIPDDRRIAPTVITGITAEDSLMQEENFGPILPLIEVEGVDEAIEFVGQRPIPLVLYTFTRNEETKQKIVEKTNSGRISFNDTFTLLMVHEIPFGGHGHSGYGSYFDKHTFDVFTHHRGSIDVPAEEEPNLEGRYPPYTEEKYKERGAIMWLPLPDA